MYVIRLDRDPEPGKPATLWLKSVRPLRWGERSDALKFATRREAMNSAQSVPVASGTWTVLNV
jgi:hypothetical protein